MQFCPYWKRVREEIPPWVAAKQVTVRQVTKPPSLYSYVGSTCLVQTYI